MLLYILIEIILVALNPILGLIGVPLCLILNIVKTAIVGEKKQEERKWDEFDCWQDNQGL